MCGKQLAMDILRFAAETKLKNEGTRIMLKAPPSSVATFLVHVKYLSYQPNYSLLAQSLPRPARYELSKPLDPTIYLPDVVSLIVRYTTKSDVKPLNLA